MNGVDSSVTDGAFSRFLHGVSEPDRVWIAICSVVRGTDPENYLVRLYNPPYNTTMRTAWFDW